MNPESHTIEGWATKCAELQMQLAQAQRRIERLRTMRTVEMMCENVNVDAHVREWETRCLKAEQQLAQAQQDNRNQFDVMWGIIDEFHIKQVGAGCPDAQIKDHITALNEQLTQTQRERDQWKTNAEFGNSIIAQFKEQLAQAQQERDEYKHLYGQERIKDDQLAEQAQRIKELSA